MAAYGYQLILGGVGAVFLGIAIFITSIPRPLPGLGRNGLWQGPLVVILGATVIYMGRKAIRAEHAARLPETLDLIRKGLRKQIPRQLQAEARELRGNVAALFIAYHDSSVVHEGNIYCSLMTDESRRKLIESGNEPKWWNVMEANDAEFRVIISAHDVLECYDIMLNQREHTNHDDVGPFREMIQAVARELNAVDWSMVMPTTDDFVVTATDSSGLQIYDDLEASVPAEKLQLLRSRNMMP